MPTSNVQTSYGSTTSIPISSFSPSPVNNSSNSRAIVGGVISGIAAIIVALLIFYLRCRRRRDEFGGNFKPDRIISYPSGSRTFPQVDLDEENEFTPYLDHASGSSMCQYGENPFLSAGVAAGARASIRTTSQSSLNVVAATAGEGYPSQSFIRPGPDQYTQGRLNIYPSSNSRAMKERKAASGRQDLGLTVHHPDGGQIHSAEGGESRDLPPVYDSIWP
ncbi:hypothetical protein BDR04DRAFT_1161028 [Suillus decipiens]|nr:hypothetical protein BDR04DRAFT_1161028 [Suillus decipiens]